MARITAGRILPGGLVVPPAPKVWLGADDEWNFTQAGGCNPASSPHAGIELACMLNRRMAIHRRHYPFTNGPSGSPAKFAWPTQNEVNDTNITNPRVIPFISHGSQGSGVSGFPIKNQITGQPYSNTTPWTSPSGTVYHGIDIITGGKFDAAYTDAFTRIKNLAYPVMFNLYPEMNIQAMGAYGGYQGGTGGAGQSAFIACWRHLHGLADAAGANNMIWCYSISYDAGSVHYNPEGSSYYPGDQYVDMVGLDLYRHNFSGNVDFIYNFTVSHQKPFGILENGYDAGATKAAFVNELHTSILLPKYVETVAYIPWNFQGTGNEHIDTDATTLANYQNLAGDPAFDVFYPGGNAGGTDTAPLNSVPPALSDTSPAQSEVISVVDGQWTGQPTPVLTSMVQGAPNTAAAQLAPLAVYGFSSF